MGIISKWKARREAKKAEKKAEKIKAIEKAKATPSKLGISQPKPTTITKIVSKPAPKPTSTKSSKTTSTKTPTIKPQEFVGPQTKTQIEAQKRVEAEVKRQENIRLAKEKFERQRAEAQFKIEQAKIKAERARILRSGGITRTQVLTDAKTRDKIKIETTQLTKIINGKKVSGRIITRTNLNTGRIETKRFGLAGKDKKLKIVGGITVAQEEPKTTFEQRIISTFKSPDGTTIPVIATFEINKTTGKERRLTDEEGRKIFPSKLQIPEQQRGIVGKILRKKEEIITKKTREGFGAKVSKEDILLSGLVFAETGVNFIRGLSQLPKTAVDLIKNPKNIVPIIQELLPNIKRGGEEFGQLLQVSPTAALVKVGSEILILKGTSKALKVTGKLTKSTISKLAPSFKGVNKSKIVIPTKKVGKNIILQVVKAPKKTKAPIKRRISIKELEKQSKIKNLSERISKELQKRNNIKLNQFDELRLEKSIQSRIRDAFTKTQKISKINIPKIKNSKNIQSLIKKLKSKKKTKKAKIMPKRRVSIKILESESKIKNLSERISKELQKRNNIKLNQFDELRLEKSIQSRIRDALGETKKIPQINIPKIKNSKNIQSLIKKFITKKKTKAPIKRRISIKELEKQRKIKKLSEIISNQLQKRNNIKLNQFDELRLEKSIQSKIRNQLSKDVQLVKIPKSSITPNIKELKKIIKKPIVKANIIQQRSNVIRKFVKEVEKQRGIKLSKNKRALIENNILKSINKNKIKIGEIAKNTKKLQKAPKIIQLPKASITKKKLNVIKKEVKKEAFKELNSGNQKLLLKNKKAKVTPKQKVISLQKQMKKVKTKTKKKQIQKQIQSQKSLQKQMKKVRAKQKLLLMKRTKLKLKPLIPISKSLESQISSVLKKSASQTAQALKSEFITKGVTKTIATSVEASLKKKAQATALKRVGTSRTIKITAKKKIISKPRLKKKKTKKPKEEKRKQGYNVKARPIKKRKGQKKPKLVKINIPALEFNKAKDLRNYIADTSLARTARIVKTIRKPKKPVLKVPKDYAKKTSRKFRSTRTIKGKKVPLPKGKIIERSAKGRNFLLDTKQEKAGIGVRKRLAQLKKDAKKSVRKRVVRKKTKATPAQLRSLKKARAARKKK